MQLTFKYLSLPFALGGRGGVQRFFLLANNIAFEEDLVEMADWGSAEKERIQATGENPCGSLPLIYVKDHDKQTSPHLIQHIAASRYLAHCHGLTKDNTAYEEYVQDLVADEYQGFRDLWVHTAFSGSEEEKAKYKTEQIHAQLDKFEKLYAKYKLDGVYLSVSKTTGQPLWGDAALFGLIRDNIITGFVTMEELKEKYPNLTAMVEAFGSIVPVKEWIEEKNAKK